MKSNDLRPGMAIRLDGKLYVITQFTHVTPGNLRAFVQVKLKAVDTGLSIEKRLRSGEEVEYTELDKREMQYLYSDNSGHVFMDNENFEQYTLSPEFVGDMMLYLKPNTNVVVLVNDGKPITVDLPKTVDLVVADTTPQVKGATATNQMKEATMETGLKTRVPPFIEVGETLRISTEDGSYLSRA
jgi:elongation factor P